MNGWFGTAGASRSPKLCANMQFCTRSVFSTGAVIIDTRQKCRPGSRAGPVRSSSKVQHARRRPRCRAQRSYPYRKGLRPPRCPGLGGRGLVYCGAIRALTALHLGVENERGLRSRAIRLRRASVTLSERVCAAARAEQGARRAYLRPGDGARAFLDRDRNALGARAEADVASDAVASAVREQALVARVARPKVDLGLAHARHAVYRCLSNFLGLSATRKEHGKCREEHENAIVFFSTFVTSPCP